MRFTTSQRDFIQSSARLGVRLALGSLSDHNPHALPSSAVKLTSDPCQPVLLEDPRDLPRDRQTAYRCRGHDGHPGISVSIGSQLLKLCSAETSGSPALRAASGGVEAAPDSAAAVDRRLAETSRPEP